MSFINFDWYKNTLETIQKRFHKIDIALDDKADLIDGKVSPEQLKQSDWIDNNPNSITHIQNRTHYSDGFYEVEERVVYVEPTKIIPNGDMYIVLPSDFIPVEGHTYKVDFDNIGYECTAFVDFEDAICLGNTTLAGGEVDSSEPFSVILRQGILYVFFTTEEEHTISIFTTHNVMKEKVHTLDDKYVPDTVSRVGHSHVWNDLTDKPFGDITQNQIKFQVDNENIDYENGECWMIFNPMINIKHKYTIVIRGDVYENLTPYLADSYYDFYVWGAFTFGGYDIDTLPWPVGFYTGASGGAQGSMDADGNYSNSITFNWSVTKYPDLDIANEVQIYDVTQLISTLDYKYLPESLQFYDKRSNLLGSITNAQKYDSGWCVYCHPKLPFNIFQSYKLLIKDDVYSLSSPTSQDSYYFIWGGDDTDLPFQLQVPRDGVDDFGNLIDDGGNYGYLYLHVDSARYPNLYMPTDVKLYSAMDDGFKQINPKYIPPISWDNIGVSKAEGALFNVISFYTDDEGWSTDELPFFDLVRGEMYTVIWNGVTYQCMAVDDMYGGEALGNFYIVGEGEDTGEPFFIYEEENGAWRGVCAAPDTYNTLTIAGTMMFSTPMPEEYLPDTVITTSDIEAIRPKSAYVVLVASSWVNNQQTVNVHGVSESESAQLIHIIPALSSKSDYQDAGISCTAQGENSLTFVAEITPLVDLNVHIVIQEV